MKFLQASSFFLLVCTLLIVESSAELSPCVCPRNLDPVCGSDGKTYNNPCVLKCEAAETDNGLELVHKGKCDVCMCPMNLDPVCGSDGKTYDNQCVLGCAHQLMAHTGSCDEKIPVVAEPVCACPYNYAPICGTDGKTYSNQCALNCEAKTQHGRDMELKVAHAGSCEDVCVCPLMLLPICGNDGKTYDNECQLECEAKTRAGLKMAYQGDCAVPLAAEPKMCICPRIMAPVCGTDGITYDNSCILECEAETKAGLKIAHVEPCAVPYAADVEICPLIFAPVCGTDGKTYDNECMLNYAAKSHNVALKVDHVGGCIVPVVAEPMCRCPKNLAPVCGTDGKTYNNQCLMNCVGSTMAHFGICEEKICVCPRIMAPVCGTDGVTYDNSCILDCEAETKPSLKIAYYDSCDEVAVPASVPICPMIFAPVCGTDGVTYDNECKLNYAATQHVGLKVAYNGGCKIAVAPAVACACPRNYAPICGTDGKTYANQCTFECEVKDHSGLKMAHQGECAIPLAAADVSVCPMIFAPVCGTDGKTYSNECLLNFAAKSGQVVGLKVDHVGGCIVPVAASADCVCFRNYAPVCGTDGKTYGNQCTFECEAKDHAGLKMAHQGECVVPLAAADVAICPLIFAPVCGTDGQTYSNECLLKSAAKSGHNAALKVDHVGGCIIPVAPATACACPMIFAPICGSDGKTYSNQCTLNCEAKDHAGLKMAYQGQCAVPYAAAADFVCACPDNYAPVCGSDATTYANQCMLNCQAKSDRELSMAHKGQCD